MDDHKKAIAKAKRLNDRQLRRCFNNACALYWQLLAADEIDAEEVEFALFLIDVTLDEHLRRKGAE